MDRERERNVGNKYIVLLILVVFFIGCKDNPKPEAVKEAIPIVEVPKQIFELGFNLNNYVVKRDTIRSGDTFGLILFCGSMFYSSEFQKVNK